MRLDIGELVEVRVRNAADVLVCFGVALNVSSVCNAADVLTGFGVSPSVSCVGNNTGEGVVI